MKEPCTVIFQSAKLGDLPQILDDLAWANRLLRQNTPVRRAYGLSGSALVALAFSLAVSAQMDGSRWGEASQALDDFSTFVHRARSHHLRLPNLNPLYGIYNLRPLRRWVAGRLQAYCGRSDLRLSELSLPLYLCALDVDGILVLYGPPDESLQFDYQFVHVGPPQDAPILDALTAALSTMLSTAPVQVNGAWMRDCRPAIVDAGAIVADLEIAAPGPILRTPPYAPIRPWPLNWITSSFIMHSQNERNQTLLAACYLDLLNRHRALEAACRNLAELVEQTQIRQDSSQDPSSILGLTLPEPGSPLVGHVNLPYIGSTEAFTNMRQSVQNKVQLMARFRNLLNGQLEGFPFDQPANVIYGAGGFSGILAGLVTTRAVDEGFREGGGQIRQIYGVSAGVLNGFFHAVQVAASRYPDLYTPSAYKALDDLEDFMAHCEPRKIARFNLNPVKFWAGWANLGPLEQFLLDRLAAYAGSKFPAQITFDDLGLPLTVTAARSDGFTDFLGTTQTDRRMVFGGCEWKVSAAPVVRAIIAGWSMNTYILPTELNAQQYRDGGGTFYDPGLLVALLDPELTNLLNIHLDDPEGHSYYLPPRPSLVRILLDTHNWVFPEERRRMRLLTDLLYAHYRLRRIYTSLLAQLPVEVAAAHPLPPDFRRKWIVA